MKRSYIITLIILVIGISIFLASTNSESTACIENKKCFDIEFAGTEYLRELGLSNRESLPQNNGMLFVFEEDVIPGFWMKDMNFPLDIIWIDSNFEIVGIEKDIQPCETIENCPAVFPEREIRYVLEINSGLSDFYDFKEGDSVKIRQ